MLPSVRKDAPFPAPHPHRIVFDRFEVDLRSGELRKNNSRIRLQAQPFQLLVLLLLNAGQVVTRDEICRELWRADTFVDFEHSLAAAVNKIRDALGDSAAAPKYIETLPKRGYRFIGNITPERPVVLPTPDTKQSVELAPVSPPKSSVVLTWTIGLGIAVGIAGLFFVWAFRKPGHSDFNSRPITAVPFTSYRGIETAPSLSPDGSRIAFSWDPKATNSSGRPGYDLYVKGIGNETVLRLTNHPSEWVSSTWSPDGTQIAFHRLAADDNGIYVVPALGGPERKLIATHTPYDLAAPLSWSPDGKWIGYSDTENGRFGDRAFLLNTETLESHEFPHDPTCLHEGLLTFSHSGRQLLILCVHNLTALEYFVTDLQGKSRRSLTTFSELPSSAIWSADDKSVIVAVSTPKSTEFAEIRISDGEVHKLPGTAGDWPTISPDGHKLAFSVADNHTSIWQKDLQHPETPAAEMFPSTRRQDSSQYSPDGRHIAFDSERTGTWSVWMADTDGSNLVQISQGEPAGFPQWSPDSQKIAFVVTEPAGHVAVYIADISDRVAHKLKTNVRDTDLPSWSHDGKWIYFLGYEGTGHQLYRSPANGGDATLLVGVTGSTMPIESSDGEVLYFPNQWVDAQMMTLMLDRPGAMPQQVPQMPEISDQTRWALTPNGIYFSPQDTPRSIYFYDFASKLTRELFRVDRDLTNGISVSPDRHYLLYSQIDQSNSEIMLVNDFR